MFDKVDFLYSQMIMDYREVPDDIDLLFIEGSVSTDHDYNHAIELRKKAKHVVAVGACACFGGIPGMRNFYSADEILKETYPINGDEKFEGPNKLLPKVKSLHSVIEVEKGYERSWCGRLRQMRIYESRW